MFEIRAAAHCPLVGDEIVQRNESYGNAKKSALHPSLPCICELDASDPCENVDADRSNADLIHDALLGECFRRDPIVLERNAELRKSMEHPCGVFHRVANPQVQILRVARLRVFMTA